MTGKFIHLTISLVVFAGLSLVLVFLTSKSRSQAAATEAREAAHEHAETEHDHGSPQEHDHEPGDPDHDASHEPVGLDELSQIECEHGIAILDCDECRYEVGVAKLDPALADGLVETYRVQAERRVRNRLTVTGEIQLDLTRVTEIASAGSGRVESIHRLLGDVVRAADPLAVIQSSDFGQAQAHFLDVQAKLHLARQTYDREKKLSEQKISSQADFLTAQNELATAQAALAAASHRLRLFGLGNEQIEAIATADGDETFGQWVLTSPIAGTILEQDIVRGQRVDAGRTLYRIADLSRVWVWCDVYESDLGALYDRMASTEDIEAEIHVRAFPNDRFIGTIDLFGSQVDRKTRTLKVRLVADNPQGRLKPGMFVTAFIPLGECEQVVHVPATAVLSDEGAHFVFVRLTDELWIRRDITVGHRDKGMVEVLDGLSDAETLAVRGAFMFKSEVLKEKMGAGCAH